MKKNKPTPKESMIASLSVLAFCSVLGCCFSSQGKLKEEAIRTQEQIENIQQEIQTKEENQIEQLSNGIDEITDFLDDVSGVTPVKKEIEYFSIDDVFGNDFVQGSIENVNFNYHDDSIIDHKLKEMKGYKAIKIDIKMTNLSDVNKTVYDKHFELYADNTFCEAYMFVKLLPHETEIPAGRSVIIPAVYFVPEDTEKIEIEYLPIGEKNSTVYAISEDVRQIITIK